MAASKDSQGRQKHVEAMIRSFLISAKEGVGLGSFANDYRVMCGEEVPYREFGYPTLHAYLISIPHVARLIGITVYGVADDKSAHIADMVGKQRAKQKKRGEQVCQGERRFFAAKNGARKGRNGRHGRCYR